MTIMLNNIQTNDEINKVIVEKNAELLLQNLKGLKDDWLLEFESRREVTILSSLFG